MPANGWGSPRPNESLPANRPMTSGRQSTRRPWVRFSMASQNRFCCRVNCCNLASDAKERISMGKITGLGGAFLKAKDPKSLYAWYEQHLGIRRAEHGSFMFEKSSVTGATVLAFFPEDTDHFGPGGQRAMLNFRVDDLDGLLDAMAA